MEKLLEGGSGMHTASGSRATRRTARGVGNMAQRCMRERSSLAARAQRPPAPARLLRRMPELDVAGGHEGQYVPKADTVISAKAS